MTSLDPSRRTRVIIQSRLNSSRLPGKAMLDIAGSPLIVLVSRRASRSGHEVVVATSDEDYDEIIASAVESAGIPVVRGSLDDVLDRFVTACEDLDDDDLVVRLTGDNPLVDSTLIDDLIAATAESGHRYGRVDIEAAPEGFGAEVFTAADLRAAAATATDAFDREHVTPWLRRTLGEHLHVPPGSPADIHTYRATVDTLNDYVRVSRLFRGAPDPIEADWRALIGGLRTAGALGPLRAPRKDHSLVGSAALALDCTELTLGGTTATERASGTARIRELLVAAVDAGITDLVLDAGSEATPEVVNKAGFPALADRLTFLIRVDGSHPDAHAQIERTFASLGRRRARGLIAGSPVDGADSWPLLTSYVTAGVTRLAGCVVECAQDLEAALALPGLNAIEMNVRSGDWWAEVEEDVLAARDRGVLILVRLNGDHASRSRDFLRRPWCDGVIVGPSSALDLGEILRGLEGPVGIS